MEFNRLMSSVISTYGEIEFSSNTKVSDQEEKKQEISKKNYPIKEITIVFKDRFKGKSKIPILEIFSTLKNLFIISINKKINK